MQSKAMQRALNRSTADRYTGTPLRLIEFECLM